MNKVEQRTCDSNPAGFCAGHQFSGESVPRPAPVAPLGVFLPRLVDEQVPRVQHRRALSVTASSGTAFRLLPALIPSDPIASYFCLIMPLRHWIFKLILMKPFKIRKRRHSIRFPSIKEIYE
ncbi:hypothetical protein CDAR_311821 [Caerostris darwini]|uniref:Uncharacterized protein n=1 Tax=Caerostris darwini TaxID=1538125 RepID=A0AAV4R0Z2_9ARAC|nr:hypothetical protein CDAR_311821 [Caerostris darwini]